MDRKEGGESYWWRNFSSLPNVRCHPVNIGKRHLQLFQYFATLKLHINKLDSNETIKIIADKNIKGGRVSGRKQSRRSSVPRPYGI